MDEQTIKYLRLTGRPEENVKYIESYLKAQGLYRQYDGSQQDPDYSGEILELDLSTVEPSLAGPKRPHDHVTLADMKNDWKVFLHTKFANVY